MNTTKHSFLDYGKVRKAFLVLRAIQHNFRIQIIQLFLEKKEMDQWDMCHHFRKLPPSRVLQHVAILKRAGVVNIELRNRTHYYSLDESRMWQIKDAVTEFLDKYEDYLTPLLC